MFGEEVNVSTYLVASGALVGGYVLMATAPHLAPVIGGSVVLIMGTRYTLRRYPDLPATVMRQLSSGSQVLLTGMQRLLPPPQEQAPVDSESDTIPRAPAALEWVPRGSVAVPTPPSTSVAAHHPTATASPTWVPRGSQGSVERPPIIQILAGRLLTWQVLDWPAVTAWPQALADSEQVLQRIASACGGQTLVMRVQMATSTDPTLAPVGMISMLTPLSEDALRAVRKRVAAAQQRERDGQTVLSVILAAPGARLQEPTPPAEPLPLVESPLSIIESTDLPVEPASNPAPSPVVANTSFPAPAPQSGGNLAPATITIAPDLRVSRWFSGIDPDELVFPQAVHGTRVLSLSPRQSAILLSRIVSVASDILLSDEEGIGMLLAHVASMPEAAPLNLLRSLFHTVDLQVSADGGYLLVVLLAAPERPESVNRRQGIRQRTMSLVEKVGLSVLLPQMLPAFAEQVGQNALIIPIGRGVGIGVGEGAPVLWDLHSQNHIGIFGKTGTGKDALIKSILLLACLLNDPNTLRVVVIDPKATDYGFVSDLPHAWKPTVITAAEGVETLQHLIRLVRFRGQVMGKALGARDPNIDKFNALSPAERQHAWQQAQQAWQQTEDAEIPDVPAAAWQMPYILVILTEINIFQDGSMGDLISIARAAGVRLIVSGQRPQAKSGSAVLPILRTQLSMLLCGRVGVSEVQILFDTTNPDSLQIAPHVLPKPKNTDPATLGLFVLDEDGSQCLVRSYFGSDEWRDGIYTELTTAVPSTTSAAIGMTDVELLSDPARPAPLAALPAPIPFTVPPWQSRYPADLHALLERAMEVPAVQAAWQSAQDLNLPRRTVEGECLAGNERALVFLEPAIVAWLQKHRHATARVLAALVFGRTGGRIADEVGKVLAGSGEVQQ